MNIINYVKITPWKNVFIGINNTRHLTDQCSTYELQTYEEKQ